jgi:hypothetical protein
LWLLYFATGVKILPPRFQPSSLSGVEFHFIADPHIKVGGQQEAVTEARERIMAILDTKVRTCFCGLPCNHRVQGIEEGYID